MTEDYSKTRDMSLFAAQKCIVQKNYRSTGRSTSTLTSVAAQNVSNSFSGTRNPKWKSQIRRLASATTPASGVAYSHIGYGPVQAFRSVKGTFPLSDIITQDEYSYGFPSYSYPSALSVPASVRTEVDNRAIRKFLDKAQNARSSFMSGEDIGEWKETLHGLRHPFDSARRLVLDTLRNFKKRFRRRKPNPHQLKKAIADSYLEWTFGWKPLALDIQSAVEGLAKARPDTVEIEASAMGNFAGVSATGTVIGAFGSFNQLGFASQVNGYYYRRFKGKIKTGAQYGETPILQELQLTPRDFIPTVWNLLPYSFVLDYFVNVGDIINALSFRFSDLVYLVDTTRTVTERAYTPTGFLLKPSNFAAGVSLDREWFRGGNTRMRVTSFARSVGSFNDLLPTVTFQLPLSEKPWLNLSFLTLARATNAAIAKDLGFG